MASGVPSIGGIAAHLGTGAVVGQPFGRSWSRYRPRALLATNPDPAISGGDFARRRRAAPAPRIRGAHPGRLACTERRRRRRHLWRCVVDHVLLVAPRLRPVCRAEQREGPGTCIAAAALLG